MKSFDGVNLASHILQMVLRHWQDQYKLMGATVPQSMWKLLEALECIEKAFLNDKECKGSCENTNGGDFSMKKMVPFSYCIPK